MNKVKKRTFVILILAALLLIGVCWFLVQWEQDGGYWASYPSNDHAYSNGDFVTGKVMDRNGDLLLTDGLGSQREYMGDSEFRKANLYAVGDRKGNIGGAATELFRDKMLGYSMINGVYSMSGKGGNVWLSVDSELNRTAYRALDGRAGCVAVMDHSNGQILCMVSTRAFDPADPPSDADYLNKFLSGVFVPGSIFKLVTSWAALENLDMSEYSYYCDGSADYQGASITCTHAHGQVDFNGALAVSCNGAFADIAQKLGGETLREYAEKAGLTTSHEVSGFVTSEGNFEAAEEGTWNLGWSGAGQYNDLVNPYAMLRFISAIPNDGRAVDGELISKATNGWGIPWWVDVKTGDDRIMSADTAAQLKMMMANNVQSNYGVDNFPNLPLCAKSGTAEVAGNSPHAWFVGFLNSTEYPYTFVVLVENGGSGASVAGSIANTVLQELCFGE